MPVYEYECEQCGQISEHWLRISDPKPDKCPHCGGGPLKKIVSLSSFHLKGTGWYVTDYARKNGSPQNGKKPAKTESSEKKSDTVKEPKQSAESTEKTKASDSTKSGHSST